MSWTSHHAGPVTFDNVAGHAYVRAEVRATAPGNVGVRVEVDALEGAAALLGLEPDVLWWALDSAWGEFGGVDTARAMVAALGAALDQLRPAGRCPSCGGELLRSELDGACPRCGHW